MTSEQSILAAAILLTFVLLLPFMVSAWRRTRIDPFAPPTLLAFSMALGFLLPLPAILSESSSFFTLWPFAFYDFYGAISKSLVLAALGALAFYAGYYSGDRLGRRLSIQPLSFLGRNSLSWMPVMTAAVAYGLCSWIAAGVITNSFTDPTELLSDRIRATEGYNYFIVGTYVLMTVALVWLTSLLLTKSLIPFRFLLFSACAVLLCLSLGNKSIVLLGGSAGICMYHKLRHRISALSFFVAVLAVLIASSAFDLFTREYIVFGYFKTQDTAKGIVPLLGTLLSDHVAGNFIKLQML
jgi:hypothetical protein